MKANVTWSTCDIRNFLLKLLSRLIGLFLVLRLVTCVLMFTCRDDALMLKMMVLNIAP